MSSAAIISTRARESGFRSAGSINWDGYFLTILALIASMTVPVLADRAQSFQLDVSLVSMSVGIIGLVRANWIATAFIGFPTWSLLGAVVSNMLIEQGEYIIEQFRAGFFIGSTSLLVTYALAGLLSTHFLVCKGFRMWRPELEPARGPVLLRYTKLLAAGLLVLLVVQASLLALYGTSTDADRFSYWNSMSGPLRTVAQTIRAMNGPIMALAFFLLVSARTKRFAFLISLELLFMQASFWLMGDKFTPFFSAALAGLSGAALAFALSGKRTRFKFRYAALTTVAAGATLALLARGMARMSTTSDLGAALFDRAVLQGHVWFGVLDLVQRDGAPLVHIDDLLAPQEPGIPRGLDALSILVTRPDYVLERMERGLTFTMGGPAAPLALTGGFLGLLVYAALLALYALQFRFLVAAARRGKMLSVGIGFLFSVSITSIVLMGNWSSGYNSASLLFYAAVLGLLVTTSGPFEKYLKRPTSTARSSEAAPPRTPYAAKGSECE